MSPEFGHFVHFSKFMFGVLETGEFRPQMEKEQLAPGQIDNTPDQDVTIDLESTHELAQQGQKLLEVSKELTSSSKALLEQLDPII